jgi:hypothetical protein
VLASLAYERSALEQEDSNAIRRIAGEVSSLQAYPDWRLLSYAICMPGADEPQLQQVVQVIEALLEEAVQGLSTLSHKTLRWLRSPRPEQSDVRPSSHMQNPSSQLRATRLLARLLCYCLRLVAAEKE